ncbi:MAG: DUF1553 domain-containing protein [Saprospiraceae bacterium]|nr:DUF1553 domain-containing protein [Saprospiraceae bacterium]
MCSCGYIGRNNIDFNTQVRPILNKKCMTCHGGIRQKGGLSFLFRESALDSLTSGDFAIVPGSANKSTVIERINERDPELRMPPEGSPLDPNEISILTNWIKQGAQWQDHWAYVAPNPSLEPPELSEKKGKRDLDKFVLNRLRAEGLTLSEEASKPTLLRRVSLDLIGLPPPESLANKFLDDASEDAFENLVDSLLASLHFGERWASFWLDLARYADSQGYQKDNLRPTMWMYRDWVIDAFNQDMPFDSFTIYQLAGDLLTRPNEDQLLATAFHRNTMSNDEGGTDDEEFRVAAVLDRVNTTYEVWQGTTMGCVQCHSHPYDPIRHEEYYRAYALFNNTQDRDHTSDEPKMELLSSPQRTLKTDYWKQIELLRETGDTIGKTYEEMVNAFMAINPLKVPVMRELPLDSSRTSHVFVRGNWLVHGEEVQPGVPEALGQPQSRHPTDRLELAQWLVHSKNPLTGRVMVNRFWEQLFGRGLVETLEDFGSQGSVPIHQELLDWLAIQFSDEHRWSVKSLLKQIVMSATYRQTSKISPQLYQMDPYNTLLARGPRVRLSAEQIRDQALSVSGLLNGRVYGPSVMPPQPEGVWNVIRHVKGWQTSFEPENQNRRAIYTFWRRVSPYPSMISFDATSRELCVSRRIRTNTPLQAFVTLNDPVFFGAAQSLATRMLENSDDVLNQISFGFQQTLFREPTHLELETMQSLFRHSLDLYGDTPIEVSKITDGIGEESPSMAALINIASAILNLDETITKG